MTQALRIGSLCTGYGGLDMAVMEVFNGELSWCADNDRHVAVVLAAQYQDVPNLGDITKLNWQRLPPVDVLCAGFPCQDISIAGRGAGIRRGTRSGIWINIVEGIRILAPKIIIVENVAAIRRRGLDRVLGDLAALGYDASWTSLRASDIGAAHRRERVFVLAHRPAARDLLLATDTSRQRRSGRPTRRGPPGRRPPGRPERLGDHHISNRTCSNQARLGTSDSAGWGRYDQAIHRWAAITGRVAPYPTETGTRGQPRLSTAFSEWLMGLPAGFVTALGLPYTAQHRVIGNGVMPRQAAAALCQLVRQAVR
jgi:DNA (cytosine-5)-methyltransferase 1